MLYCKQNLVKNNLKKYKILIIEDSKFVNNAVKTTLSNTNSVILEALKASSNTMRESQTMLKETTTISKEMENINDISNQNSNSMSEITIASSHLNQLTAELNTKLDKFRI